MRGVCAAKTPDREKVERRVQIRPNSRSIVVLCDEDSVESGPPIPPSQQGDFLPHRLLGLLAALAMVAGCATTTVEPVLPELQVLERRTPVVVVPGITGTVLENAETGETLWGNFRTLLRPPDGGYAIALPITGGPAPVEAVPAGPVMRIDYVVGRKTVYDTVARLMVSNGYVQGDLALPRPGENFFFFAYDWRRSNVESARELVRHIENLAAAGEQAVDLVCQSNATHICRWALKYGDVSLEEAESGIRRTSAAVSIRKVVFVGTAHGGSIRILREMDRGRRYIPLVGGLWAPEVFFTFESLYQDLPVYRSDLFFDSRGELLDVELFDAESWVRFEWSVFSPRVARRLGARADLFGTREDRIEWLQTSLDRAVRFHRLLDGDIPVSAALYSIQNLYTPTPDRAMLEVRDGEWATRFTRDREIDGDPRRSALASQPGDGHANVYSQRWLSASELEAMAERTSYFDGGHFEIITLPAAQRRLLEMLAEAVIGDR
jgi:hypothetical protein